MEKDICLTDLRNLTSHTAFLRKLFEDVPQKNKEVSQERRRYGIQETIVLPRRKKKGIPKMTSGQQAREQSV